MTRGDGAPVDSGDPGPAGPPGARPADGGRRAADRSVRPGVPEDAQAIADIQVSGVRAEVQVGLGDGVEAPAIDSVQVRRQWTDTLSGPQPEGCHTLVALHGARVVGFAACAPGPQLPGPPGRDPVPAGTDILALEVHADFARAGHGSRLLSALVDSARPQTLRVWVVAGDDAHVRFYESAGLAPAGLRRRLDTGVGSVAEHLWWARLDG